MCMAHEFRCSCGARSASFHFRDNILPEQVLKALYCPACSAGVAIDPADMVEDNGWVVRYDMEVAALMARGRIEKAVTPGLLFDEGYCSWNGIYPGDHIDSVREREEIIALSRTNPVEYIRQLKTWAAERQERLQHAGWRKARNAA